MTKSRIMTKLRMAKSRIGCTSIASPRLTSKVAMNISPGMSAILVPLC